MSEKPKLRRHIMERKKRRRVTGISLIGMLLLFYHSNSVAQPSLLEFVKQGCQANDHLVHSGMGHLTCDVKFLQSSEECADYKAEIFFAFEGEKLRYDSECLFPKTRFGSKRREILEEVFDGEKTIRYRCNHFLDEGTIFPGGSISEKNIIDMDNVPISYGIAFFSKSLEDLLSEPEAKLVQTETINGDICYRVRTVYRVGSESVPLEILINSARGFRSQEIKVFGARGVGTISIALEELERGIWFPKTIKLQFASVSDERKEILLKDDFKINVDIPDDLFTIKFPSGIPVYDSRIKKSFRAE